MFYGKQILNIIEVYEQFSSEIWYKIDGGRKVSFQKSQLDPDTFYWSAYTKTRNGAMYLCVGGIYFTFFATIFQLDFETV